MFRLFLLLLCVLVAVTADTANSQESLKFFENVGWLKLHRVPATWDEARRTCQREGGILASPTTEPLLASMVELMNDHRTLLCGVFTGIHSTYTKGSYYTIDGIPLSKIAAGWSADYSQNRRAYADNKCFKSFNDCLILYHDGKLADKECTSYLPFICYKAMNQMNESINPCSTTDHEYKLDFRTGSCYKFHRSGQTWTQATETCTAEGGHLAIINSQVEAEVLKELFTKHPTNTLGSQYKNSAMLGFLDWGQQGSWTTIYGQTLQDTGYASWSPGQPDNAKGPSGQPGQPCGAMFRSGLLDDVWCDVKLAFICEKSPTPQA